MSSRDTSENTPEVVSMLPESRPRRSPRLARAQTPQTMAHDKLPVIKNGKDLKITVMAKKDGSIVVVKWIYITADDKVYMGMSRKRPEDISLEEFAAGLVRIDDNEAFAEIPTDTPITIAPGDLTQGGAFIKHPGVKRYETPKELVERGFRFGIQDCGGDGRRAKDQLLEEVLMLEKVSKMPHPYIVRYLGCRTRRGRITSIVLESLEWNLFDYATKKPDDFAQLDKEAFLAGLESAVKFLHSLGLAHNDLSPGNVMLREADDGSLSPVLIDFDSCGPFGGRLLSSGTRGFIESGDPEHYISLKRHDEYAFGCLREWWDKDLEEKLIMEEPEGRVREG
ncbi:kinase-like domain-containing protein [Chaetomidium leptoderma]|uniref:Kinase-like domain-containing protein n=1 Tax=Chaetomidium leptoderma TaxID=669021 RepID=A0AAN6VNN9_9PEZI|nr:kinase-like domain-containing protein [Chaetomidium leptoderma]